MNATAQVLLLLACLLIIYRAEPALNRMGEDTPLSLRVAFLLLSVSAAGGILYTLIGHIPDWLTVLFAVGAAALLFCERRIKVLTRCRFKQPKGKGPRHA